MTEDDSGRDSPNSWDEKQAPFTSKKINRNKLLQWAITFPQYQRCAATKSEGRQTNAEILDKTTFHTNFPPNNYVCCCEEEHEDGGWHLHMGIKLKNTITKVKLMEWGKENFPNDYHRIQYKVVTHWPGWIDYCNKEDPRCYSLGSLERKKKMTKQQIENEAGLAINKDIYNSILKDRHEKEHEEFKTITDDWLRERDIQKAFDDWSMDPDAIGPFKF